MGEKIFLQCLNIVTFAVVLYCFLVGHTHRLVTWQDVTWPFIWQVLKSLGILALFPLIVLPVMFLFASRHGQLQRGYPEHKFFREWVSVFCRHQGKGSGRTCFFAEDVERVNLQCTLFRQEHVYLAHARFKKKWLFRRGNERFILRVPGEAGLESFLNWARSYQIAVKIIKENQSPFFALK